MIALRLALAASLAILVAAGASPTADAGQRSSRGALRTDADRIAGAYQPAPGGRDIAARVALSRRADGVDLIFTLRNAGAEQQRLGSLVVGPIQFGENARLLALGKPGQQDALLAQGGPVSFGVYPGSMYAPVAAVESSDRVVGVSLQYPLMDRRHEAGMGVRPRGAAGAWELVVTLSGVPAGERKRMDHEAHLRPGATARYVVSLRTAPAGDWRMALEPYRAYFERSYGRVAYQRDARPVRGYTVAGTWAISNANPRGFVDASGRPDLNGWAPLVNGILSDQTADRVMLWAPSGVFRQQGELNYPFQFTTGWITGQSPGSRLDEAVDELPRVAQSGRHLGLWWGRSAQVMQGWDEPGFEHLDPDDPSHRHAAFAELDLAVDAGASMVGLDAFSHHWSPVWDLREWLATMQRRAPSVRFITEGLAPDVLHVMSPSCTTAYTPERGRDATDETYLVTGPFHLADFLLPGHETWALLRFDLLEGPRGRALTNLEVRSEIDRVMHAGYVPVVFSGAALPDAP